MAKDYKPRTPHRYTTAHRSKAKSSVLGLLKSMLITASIIGLVVGVAYWRGMGKEANNVSQSTTPSPKLIPEIKTPIKVEPPKPPAPELPRFDFYTILPEKEVIVPEHEINTRTREENLGKGKPTRYIMQAGSFKTFKEAEKQSVKLANMGIEASIQKSKVGETNWYSVKMGAYTQITSVSAIRARLRQSGIDVIVTEVGE